MMEPAKQPVKTPDSAPDIIRIPEIGDPKSSDVSTDCPCEMPVREASAN